MRHAKPYSLWKRGNYYYYRLAKDYNWKSTGRTTEVEAHRFIIEEVLNKPKEESKPDITFRQYAEPFFKWDTCPQVRRLLDKGENITRRHVRNQLSWFEKYVKRYSIIPFHNHCACLVDISCLFRVQ